MPNLDPRFIQSFVIQPYFVDKASGTPLAGGVVTFYRDLDRSPSGLKNVYQLTGTPGNYNYVNLPNPLPLSVVGTFVDSFGAPVNPYFFPFDGIPTDSTGQVDLYYVTVFNSQGVQQLTLQSFPNFSPQQQPIFGQTTLSFSSPGTNQEIFTIFNTNVTATSTVNAQVAYIAPPGKSLDELEFDCIDLKCGVGNGFFTILATVLGNPASLATGTFTVNYTISGGI